MAPIIKSAVPPQPPGLRVFGRYGMGGFAQGVRALVNAFLFDDLVEGIKKDVQVIPEGEVALVAEAVAHPLAEGEVVAAVDLGQSRDARVQGHSFFPGRGGKDGHLLRNPRAGSDEAHVAQQDVDEFRQFIQGSAAQQGAQKGGALFVRQQAPLRVPGVFHGFEFDDIKGFEAAPDALLQEKGRRPLNDDQQDGQDGE